MDQQQELSNNTKQMRLLFAQVCFDDSDFPYDPSAKQPTGVYCINGVHCPQTPKFPRSSAPKWT